MPVIPAQFTSTSTPPNAATVASTAAVHASSSVTSSADSRSRVTQLGRERFRRVDAHVGEHHPRALGHESTRGLRAHPAARARDERHLPVEPPHRFLPVPHPLVRLSTLWAAQSHQRVVPTRYSGFWLPTTHMLKNWEPPP